MPQTKFQRLMFALITVIIAVPCFCIIVLVTEDTYKTLLLVLFHISYKKLY